MGRPWEWLKGLYRREDHPEIQLGWLPGSGDAGRLRHGSCYVEVRLIDSAIRYERDRFRDQEPLVQSLVRFRVADELIPMSTTLGPESMRVVHGDGDFRNLEQRNVALTGLIPFNAGDVEIVVGLLSVPVRDGLSAVTGFLGKLADLVKVPAISTVAATAQTVAEGVETLLGGDQTRGLIGLSLGIGEPDLREDGFYVALRSKAGDPLSFGTLGVVDDQLVAYPDASRSGTPERLIGYDYVLLRVRTHADLGSAWQEIPALRDPFKKAVEALLQAGKEEAEEAKRLFWIAYTAARFSDDLTASDRGRVSELMFEQWKREVRRKSELGAGDGGRREVPGPIEEDLAGAVLASTRMVQGWDLSEREFTSMMEVV